MGAAVRPALDIYGDHTNQIDPTTGLPLIYDSANKPAYWAEETNAIWGTILGGIYSCNALHYRVQDNEVITADADFVGRQIAIAGKLGEGAPKPWADGAVEGLYWYANKAAFRVGRTTGTQWDDANVGSKSLAFGEDAKASATLAFAFGSNVLASGVSAFAYGADGIASGLYSLAFGKGAQATADYAIAMGYAPTASGNYSVCIGDTSTVSGANSFSFGRSNTVTGLASFCFGQGNVADSDNSFVFGEFASSSGETAAYVFGVGLDPQVLEAPGPGIYFGYQSNVPCLAVYNAVGGVGTIGLVGIGLGATVPSKAYLEVKASTTEFASLNLAHGTAPTAPVNGDVWTTTAGIYVRVNGVTVGPIGGAVSFSGITSGTNTTAAMLVGTGASLGTTGSGTLQATSLSGTFASVLPTTNIVPLSVTPWASATANVVEIYDTAAALRAYWTPTGFLYIKDGSNLTRFLTSGGNTYLGTQNNQRLFIESNGATSMTFDDAKIAMGATAGELAKLLVVNPNSAWECLKLRAHASQSLPIQTWRDSADAILSEIASDGQPVLSKASGKGIKIDPAAPTFGWRDLLGRIIPRDSGVTAPALAVYRGGQVRDYAFDANDVADLQFHMPHDWAPGTDIFIHVHWSHHGTAISGSLVCDFFTTFAKGFGGAIFPAEVQTTLTVSTPDVATIPQYSHRVDEVQLSAASPTANQIDTDNLEVDALLLIGFRVTTKPTVTGGVVTNDPFIHHIDIHYQSTGIGTKAKAPSFYT
jgi:hypothetical protein